MVVNDASKDINSKAFPFTFSQLVALEVSICLTQNFQERIMTKESSIRGKERRFAQLKKALAKLEKLRQGQLTQTELWKPLDKKEKLQML